MYRQLVSTCVLAGFLVTQWAAMPHSHALKHRPDDDATPHVHLAAAHGAPHNHGHDHHDQGSIHTHYHAVPAAELDVSRHECGRSDVADHDANAVYLPAARSITPARGSDNCRLLTMPSIGWSGDGVPVIDNRIALHGTSLIWPREQMPRCPLYLALRALRI